MDQILKYPESDAVVKFITTHTVGTQKDDGPDTLRYIADNASWANLHYELGVQRSSAPYIAAYPQPIFSADSSWGADYSHLPESYFIHYNGKRQCSGTECLVDISNPDLQGYTIAQVLRSALAEHAVGWFADAFIGGIGGYDISNGNDPRFQHPNNPDYWAPCSWNPHSTMDWFPADWTPPGYVEGSPCTWGQQRTYWLATISKAFQIATGGNLLLIANASGLFASGDTAEYRYADGVMAEGFGSWPGTAMLESSGTRLLAIEHAGDPDSPFYTGRSKVVLFQPTPTGARFGAACEKQANYYFVLGQFFKRDKEDRTFYYIFGCGLPKTDDTRLGFSFFPQYVQVDLGVPLAALPTNFHDYLWSGVYRRDFANGIILLNADTSAGVTVTLDRDYTQVECTGGGGVHLADIGANGDYVGGTCTRTALDQGSSLSVGTQTGVVLINR